MYRSFRAMLVFVAFFSCTVMCASFQNKGERYNWGFGSNFHGVVAVGDRDAKNSPNLMSYKDSFSDMKNYHDIVSGFHHTFLKSNEKYYGFGTNQALSLATNEDISYQPVGLDLTKFPSPIEQLKSLYLHTLGLGNDENLYGWGRNRNGQLGVGNPSDRPPIQVYHPRSENEKVVDFDVGVCHSLFLLRNGTVFGMGCNSDRQLGISQSTTNVWSPVPIDLPEFIVSISANELLSLYLSSKGNVYFTGSFICMNSSNVLVSATARLLFDSSVFGPVETISAGYNHAIVKLKNQSIVGFGCSEFCNMGKNIPTFVPSFLNTSIFENEGISQIKAGDRNSVILTEAGKLYYVGQNFSVPLVTTYHQSNSDDEAYCFLQFTELFDHFALGEFSNKPHFTKFGLSTISLLVITEDDQMFVWGSNNNFQLGISPRYWVSGFKKAVSSIFTETFISSISVAKSCSTHALGVSSDGKVYSWGENFLGQLGVGDYQTFLLPIEIQMSTEDTTKIVRTCAGSDNGVMLSERGEVFTFGNGFLGCHSMDGIDMQQTSPKKLPDGSFDNERVVEVHAGSKTIHALTDLHFKQRKTPNLFSWGDLSPFGGSSMQILPKRVDKELLNENIIQMCVCDTISIILSESESIYLWGTFQGKYYEMEPVPIPEQVSHINFVNAGHNWLLFVSNDTLWLFGTIGDVDHRPIHQHDFSEPYWKANHRIVACSSSYHTVCVLEDGSVFGIGNSDFNQLLSNHSENTFSNGMKRRYIRNFTRLSTEDFEETKGFTFSRVDVSDFSTVLQSKVTCFQKFDMERKVCSGSGLCVGNDSCQCFSGFGGDECELYSCDGLTNKSACHGHGVCFAPNKCFCDIVGDFGWGNIAQKSSVGDDLLNTYCKSLYCGTHNGEVCGGPSRGKCMYDEMHELPDVGHSVKCNCVDLYRGEKCQYDSCNGAKGITIEGDDGCGAFADCVGENRCICKTTGLNYLLPLYQHGAKCQVSVLLVITYIVVVLVVLMCCCCCCNACILLLVCPCVCIVSRERKKSSLIKTELRMKMLKEKHEKEFSDYNSPFFYISSQEEEEVEGEDLESTSLLRKDFNACDPKGEEREGIKLGDTHVFHGNLNGKAWIFYVSSEKKQYPVFKGSFLGGKKEGYGSEFRLHFNEFVKFKCVDRNYCHDMKNYTFCGFYSNDMKNGKGTEFDENGAELLVGDYVNDILIRILSIDYPLKLIDLKKDIIYTKASKKEVKKKKMEEEEDEDEETEFLGSGGFSNILAGKLKEDGIDVAVKIFKERYDEERVIMGVFERRMRELEQKELQRNVTNILKILSMFPHPNIVQIYGFSGPTRKIEDFGYVMEKCVGSVRSRYYETAQGIRMKTKNLFLFQTALGMTHIHHFVGLIHRDLKWDNVLLDNVDQVKICDFDMSDRDKLEFEGKKNISEAKGSPFHIAPECLILDQFDAKCDVYSFGIMMVELLCNRMDDPFGLMESGKCNVCGEEFDINNKTTSGSEMNIVRFMKEHYQKCKLSPLINATESSNNGDGNQKDSVLKKWQIKMMRSCCNIDPKKRPSFREIVETLKLRLNKAPDKEILFKRNVTIQKYRSTDSSINSI